MLSLLLWIQMHLGAIEKVSPMRGPFINRRNANTFMSPQQRWRAKAQERVRERNKPAYEINREACDDYKLCERYAMVYGYNAAYNRYFRQRRGAK
ncbi:Matrix Gla protein [Cricetulus griseus]|uniref:Matrix Gla protein n=1 Tax=Cricetulus griseus TaxID=10029 RepID=G3H4P4_CRIGR|nr:Matrix Gla protein [Cricetulus griseus]